MKVPCGTMRLVLVEVVWVLGWDGMGRERKGIFEKVRRRSCAVRAFPSRRCLVIGARGERDDSGSATSAQEVRARILEEKGRSWGKSSLRGWRRCACLCH